MNFTLINLVTDFWDALLLFAVPAAVTLGWLILD